MSFNRITIHRDRLEEVSTLVRVTPHLSDRAGNSFRICMTYGKPGELWACRRKAQSPGEEPGGVQEEEKGITSVSCEGPESAPDKREIREQ